MLLWFILFFSIQPCKKVSYLMSVIYSCPFMGEPGTLERTTDEKIK